MVRIARLAVVLGTLSGCYDMERLEAAPAPGYLLVDDFEDGDELPNIANFGRWSALPFKPVAGASTGISIVAPGASDMRALLGDFVLADPGGGDVTGASLGIIASRVPLDVRRFRALYVTARVESETPLPGNARVYADLNCNSAPPLGTVTKPFWVTKNMPVATDWRELRLEGFEELGTEPARIAGGSEACLAVVDGIRFTVAMSLPDDQPVRVRLFIDDVYFE
jgi:hypothetical protein